MSTPEAPLVSVIIPSYNSAQYVAAAVESILAQSYPHVEIIVVDDGSTDNTAAVMAAYAANPRVRYIRQENGGVSRARNHGIEQSSGQYIGFLDADDTWLPSKLKLQMAVFQRDPNCKACYGAYILVDADLNEIGIRHSPRRGRTLEDLLIHGNVIGNICTVVCERSLFEKVGGFDPALSQCADWDMWVRLAAHTEFVYIDEPLVTYRQHGTNMSRNAPLLERDSLLVMQKAFAMPNLPAEYRKLRRTAFAHIYMVSAGTYFQAHLLRDFARCAARSVLLDLRQLGRLAAFPLRALSRRRDSNLAGVS